MADENTIKFNGVWLEEIAPAIRIDDITVSSITYNPIAADRPERFGRQFVRNVGATRTVSIAFAIQLDDRKEREKQLQAVRDWARTDQEYPLVLPHYSDRHLEAVCTSQFDTSYRKWWQNNLQLVFTCFDNPFWTSDDVTEVQCNAEFSVGGSAPPLMTIERRLLAPATNASYISGNQVMRFSEIPAGNLVIDLNRQTAAVGGASIMRYFNPTSTFIEPKTGAMQVINGNGKIKIRERWV
jgi:phage-related protein